MLFRLAARFFRLPPSLGSQSQRQHGANAARRAWQGFLGSRAGLLPAVGGGLSAAGGLRSGAVGPWRLVAPAGMSTNATCATMLGDFQQMGLLGWFLVDLAINVGGWAVASVMKTEKFFDALGSVSFLALTAGSLATGPITPRKILVSVMVGVWTVRLGSYLVKRIHQSGKDARFDDIKGKPLTFLFAWVAQAVWVFATLSPVLIVNGMQRTVPLGLWDLLGASIFAGGLAFESIADWQKDKFRSNPENKGRYITSGLWSISRHPNYFGESLLWWGVFASCALSFTAAPQYASAAGPLFVFLLVRYGSGVPLLEKSADQKWGGEPEYQQYKADTPIFFPKLTSYSAKPSTGSEAESLLHGWDSNRKQ